MPDYENCKYMNACAFFILFYFVFVGGQEFDPTV